MLANRTIIADFSVIRGRCCSMVKMSIKNHITSHHKYVVRTRLWLVGGSYQQTRLLQLLVVCIFFFCWVVYRLLKKASGSYQGCCNTIKSHTHILVLLFFRSKTIHAAHNELNYLIMFVYVCDI